MKKRLNTNEKHVVSVLLFLSSLYGLIILFINIVITDQSLKTSISIGFIIITGIVLFFGQEAVFGTILTKMIPATKAERDFTNKHWIVRLSYEENTSKKIRNGSLEFYNSMIGVKIRGSQLFDNETGNIIQELWFAENVELINLGDKKVLLYLYKIPMEIKNDLLEKVGIVVAIQDDDAVFKGTFKDISVHDGKIQREGEISLSLVQNS